MLTYIHIYIHIHIHKFKTRTNMFWNKKYVLSNSESDRCNFFIFDHVTFIQFKICCYTYKMSSKLVDFFAEIWRYILFQNGGHLGIVLPPCETTHEVSVAGGSCLSNFNSIWYTDLKINLNFSHIWLEMPGPQNGGFGGLLTPKCDYLSSRPPKGTSLRKSAFFKLSTIKIRWGVWPVGELTESVTDTHTLTHAHTHLYSVHA